MAVSHLGSLAWSFRARVISSDGILANMLGRKTVDRQAVVTAIHFGDYETDTVTRLPVERPAHRLVQGGPCVERNRTL